MTEPETRECPGWELYCFDYNDPGLSEALDDGFEPFAVDARPSGIGLGRYITVYVRRPHARA